jgi:hypothetical protein
MKESFIFYKSWMEALKDVPDDIRLEVYDCIIEYAFSGKIPSLKPMAKMAFNFIKNDIDRASEKYAKIVDRNRNNGKNGGRPKKPENPVGFSETQENPNEDDNEDVDVNDNKSSFKKEAKGEIPLEENSSEIFPETKPIDPPVEESPKKVAGKKGSGSREKYFSAADFNKLLLDLGAEEKDAKDWINIRKQKRAVFTENAIKLVQEECKKYGLEFKEAVKYSAKYGWQGFEYEWYLNKKDKENGKSNSNNTVNGNNSAGKNGGKVDGTSEILSGNFRYFEPT